MPVGFLGIINPLAVLMSNNVMEQGDFVRIPNEFTPTTLTG